MHPCLCVTGSLYTTITKLFSRRKIFFFMTINIFFHENNSQRGVFYGSIRQTSLFNSLSFSLRKNGLYLFTLLSFSRILGIVLILLDDVIRCNLFTYSVRMSLMGNVSNGYEHAKRRVCQNVHILFFMHKAPTFSSQSFAIS